HFRGDAKELLTTVAKSYGISAQIDDSVPSRRVSFDIDRVNFFEAMLAAGRVSKTFWAPMAAKQIIVAADTPDNRKTYERMAMRTFYIPGVDRPTRSEERRVGKECRY